jgi:hypothetical protein
MNGKNLVPLSCLYFCQLRLDHKTHGQIRIGRHARHDARGLVSQPGFPHVLALELRVCTTRVSELLWSGTA